MSCPVDSNLQGTLYLRGPGPIEKVSSLWPTLFAPVGCAVAAGKSHGLIFPAGEGGGLVMPWTRLQSWAGWDNNSGQEFDTILGHYHHHLIHTNQD